MRYLFLVFIVFLTFYSCKKDSNTTTNNTISKDSLAMGSGYANDVYYSLANGVVSVLPRNGWDIAFTTNVFSPTILTNGGSGVKLYTYPGGDTSVWNTTFDISKIAQWPVMYNSDTTWGFGAFERNRGNYPDYGWAIYNQNHDLIGDSLYVIQLQDQSYKKLWIKMKATARNTFIFQYANLDGSDLKIDSVNCNPYASKNFIYYSLSQKKVVDREPASNSWDFVATKYITVIPAGPGVMMPYGVTGILTNNITNFTPPSTFTNVGPLSAKEDNVSTATTDTSAVHYNTNISTIGYDWKVFDQTTNVYSLVNNRVYFVKTKTNVYKIVFTGFDMVNGVIKFEQTKLK